MKQEWLDYLKALRQWYLEVVEWAVGQGGVTTQDDGDDDTGSNPGGPPPPPKPPGS